jgi:hypothetical protein
MNRKYSELTEVTDVSRKSMPLERLCGAIAKAAASMYQLELMKAPTSVIQLSQDNFNRYMVEFGRRVLTQTEVEHKNLLSRREAVLRKEADILKLVEDDSDLN